MSKADLGFESLLSMAVTPSLKFNPHELTGDYISKINLDDKAPNFERTSEIRKIIAVRPTNYSLTEVSTEFARHCQQRIEFFVFSAFRVSRTKISSQPRRFSSICGTEKPFGPYARHCLNLVERSCVAAVFKWHPLPILRRSVHVIIGWFYPLNFGINFTPHLVPKCNSPEEIRLLQFRGISCLNRTFKIQYIILKVL